MKVKSLLVTLLVAFIGASSVVVAQRTTIQLGMVLPANSVWDKSLKQMGANWSTATDGRVRLRVLAGADRRLLLLANLASLRLTMRLVSSGFRSFLSLMRKRSTYWRN